MRWNDGFGTSNVVIPLVKPSPPTASEIVSPARTVAGAAARLTSAASGDDAPIHLGLSCTTPFAFTRRLPYTFPLSTAIAPPSENCVGNDVTFALRQTPERFCTFTGPSSGSA